MCCANCHIWPIKVIITCNMLQIFTQSFYTHNLTWVNSKASSTKLDWKTNIFKHCLFWPRTEITETFNISNNNTWTKAIVDCKKDQKMPWLRVADRLYVRKTDYILQYIRVSVYFGKRGRRGRDYLWHKPWARFDIRMSVYLPAVLPSP